MFRRRYLEQTNGGGPTAAIRSGGSVSSKTMAKREAARRSGDSVFEQSGGRGERYDAF